MSDDDERWGPEDFERDTGPVDPAMLGLDDALLDDLAAGHPPAPGDVAAVHLAAWRDEVRRPVSGWLSDPSQPSGWRWVEDLGAMADATQMLPVVTATAGRVEYEGSVDYFTPTDEYIYTDPVADDAWPRITEVTDDDLPDAFPDGWGDGPTERDQAAIDAGNA
jgi:alpha-amylase/alpha-mannosidase (GH57 family)